MVKRIIGTLFAVVVVVVIVFTAIGAGSYESMLSADLFSSKTEPQMVEQAIEPNATESDADATVETQALESESEVADGTATTETDGEESHN